MRIDINREIISVSTNHFTIGNNSSIYIQFFLSYCTGKPLGYNHGDIVVVSSEITKVRNTEDTGSIPDSAKAGILIQYHCVVVTVMRPLPPRLQSVQRTPLQVHSGKETA